jgi:Fur family zinc uptake transcriptional regulator
VPRPSAIGENDKAILGVLSAAARPLSAYDILAELRDSAIRAPNQVYRALDKLARAGLVHRIEALNAFIACGHEHGSRPAFVICEDCGAVKELEDERLNQIARSVARMGFAVARVSLEIYGHCCKCQAHAGAGP